MTLESVFIRGRCVYHSWLPYYDFPHWVWDHAETIHLYDGIMIDTLTERYIHRMFICFPEVDALIEPHDRIRSMPIGQVILCEPVFIGTYQGMGRFYFVYRDVEGYYFMSLSDFSEMLTAYRSGAV